MTIIDKNNTVPNSKKAASLFELQYTFIKTTLDKVVLVFATLGSLAMGVALPLFSVIMGSSINSFGTTKGDYTPDIFLADIKSMCLKFLYVGIGIFFGGFFMIWLWNYNGRTTSKRIKKEYFKLLLKQEQGYFDMVNPNEFATKLQTQIKTIEMGVILFIYKL
jgi:ATP-binding cassette subfamily B (MDR/TAP) protein 1